MDPFPLLDELRIMAENGLRYADDPYDRERYERIRELVDEYYGESLDLPPEEVRERLAGELGHVTPKIGGRAAVFDADGRVLLLERVDDGTWCLPGGFTDPGESPAETAVRETAEETGLDVAVADLVDTYTRRAGEHHPHGFVGHVYLCERFGGDLRGSRESTDLAFRRVETVDEWHRDNETVATDARECWRERG